MAETPGSGGSVTRRRPEGAKAREYSPAPEGGRHGELTAGVCDSGVCAYSRHHNSRGPAVIDPATLPERNYTMLKSLAEFDKQEIRDVIKGLLAKTDRDICFLGTYYRAVANVGTLLSLKSAKDLQAIAMVARGLFELAVDVALINVVDDAVKKIFTFTAVERLRAACKIVAFKAAYPDSDVNPAVYESFIAGQGAAIDAEQKAVWPDMKKVNHWSGMNLSQRTALLKAPFEEMYQVNYPELSWYAHSGLTGFSNLPASTFNLMAGKHNKLAGDCFIGVLMAVIDEFGLEKADAKIKKKLTLAKMLPFTDGPQQAEALQQDLLG